jgi:hypothetical protein
MRILTDHGHLRIEHGRGTFVADRAYRLPLDGLGSFAQQRGSDLAKRRSRTSSWNLRGGDAGPGQDAVEGGGELTGPVADEKPECGGMVVEVHQQGPDDLLGGPVSGWMARGWACGRGVSPCRTGGRRPIPSRWSSLRIPSR